MGGGGRRWCWRRPSSHLQHLADESLARITEEGHGAYDHGVGQAADRGAQLGRELLQHHGLAGGWAAERVRAEGVARARVCTGVGGWAGAGEWSA